jgi:GxxExxY protein
MVTAIDVQREWESVEIRRKALNGLTYRIIGAAQKVHGELGRGFAEKVYENALVLELRTAGIAVEPQASLKVRYGGAVVGAFNADLLVEREVLVELKAALLLEASHRAQCINYLKASGLPVCLLLNFGAPRLEVRRFVYNF